MRTPGTARCRGFSFIITPIIRLSTEDERWITGEPESKSGQERAGELGTLKDGFVFGIFIGRVVASAPHAESAQHRNTCHR